MSNLGEKIESCPRKNNCNKYEKNWTYCNTSQYENCVFFAQDNSAQNQERILKASEIYNETFRQGERN